MNKRFLLSLLSSPVLLMSMLSTVIMARPVHAGDTVIPVRTNLSCVRSSNSGTQSQVCVKVNNATQSTPKSAIQIPVPQNQPNQNQSEEPEELVFTEAESDEAIKLFGCDCPTCISSVRQMKGLPPLPV